MDNAAVNTHLHIFVQTCFLPPLSKYVRVEFPGQMVGLVVIYCHRANTRRPKTTKVYYLTISQGQESRSNLAR